MFLEDSLLVANPPGGVVFVWSEILPSLLKAIFSSHKITSGDDFVSSHLSSIVLWLPLLSFKKLVLSLTATPLKIIWFSGCFNFFLIFGCIGSLVLAWPFSSWRGVGAPLVVVCGVCSSRCCGSLVAEHRLQGARADLLWCTSLVAPQHRDLPGPVDGNGPTALAGGFSATDHQGSPSGCF